MNCGYRIDILVKNKLVLELKCVEYLNNVYLAQTLTHLKLENFKLGLLISFDEVIPIITTAYANLLFIFPQYFFKKWFRRHCYATIFFIVLI